MPLSNRDQSQLKTHRLECGLDILVKPAAELPLVACHLWIGCGSGNESKSNNGISHIVEHMLFRGTASFSQRDLSIGVEEFGGSLNAFTSLDNTALHLACPAQHTELAIRILAEMALCPNINQADLDLEKDIILEELQEEQDDPEQQLDETLFKVIFSQHAYGRPIIGTEQSITAASIDNIREHLQQHYTPANMTLAVVGDIPMQNIVEYAEKVFPSVYQGEKIRPVGLPQPSSNKTTIVNRGSSLYSVACAWPAPEMGSDQNATLDIIAALLTHGDFSLLHEKLYQQQKIVREIDASYFCAKQGGLFSIRADHGSDVPTTKILEEIQKTMVDIAKKGVSAQRLKLAKATLERDLIFDRQTIDDQAFNFAYYNQLLGDPLWEERSYLKALRGASIQDIQQAIDVWLNPEKVKIAILKPEHVDTTALHLVPEPTSHKPESNIDCSKHLRPITKTPVATTTCDSLSTISALHVILPGALFLENRHNNGIGHLALSLFDKCTINSDENQFAKDLINLHAEFDSNFGRSFSSIRIALPTNYLERGMRLLADACRKLHVPQEIFSREKNNLLQHIDAEQDNYELTAFLLMLDGLFPDHPFSLSPHGTKVSVETLDQDQTEAHLSKMFMNANVLSICSQPVDFAIEQHMLIDQLNNMAGTGVTFQNSDCRTHPDRFRFQSANVDKSYIYIGFRTAGGENRWAEFEVLAAVLSGFGGGILYQQVREQLALAYTVHCQAHLSLHANFFSVYLSTANENEQKCLTFLEKFFSNELQLTAADLKRAKQFLTYNYYFDLQKASSRASFNALNHYFKMPNGFQGYVDSIEKITLEDLQECAKQFLTWPKAFAGIVHRR